MEDRKRRWSLAALSAHGRGEVIGGRCGSQFQLGRVEMPRIKKTRFGWRPTSVNALKRRANEWRVQKREQLSRGRVVVARRIAAEIRFDRDPVFRRIGNR